VAMGTLGRGRDDLEDGRQRRRPGRDPGGGDGDLSAGVDPDGLLQQSSRFVNRAAGYQNGNRSPWRDCGGGDGDLSAGVDPDRLLQLML